jgi:hypothetical protein
MGILWMDQARPISARPEGRTLDLPGSLLDDSIRELVWVARACFA